MTDSLATERGILYVVATPIGNRDDISVRALHTLKSVDLILAEDTRHSRPLLTALGIKNKLVSFHAHNEEDKSKEMLELLLAGKSLALISDAGTPLINDPGFPLVKRAREQEIIVLPIPGPCALITALSAAGVSCDSFLFLGFLPAKQQARQKKLLSLQSEPHTLIFYESTHRILQCVDDIGTTYGEQCELVLAKELTKTFERFISGTVLEVKHWLLAEPGHLKGEFVGIIPARPIPVQASSNDELLGILLKELPLKQAVSIFCKFSNANKNEVYERALQIKREEFS